MDIETTSLFADIGMLVCGLLREKEVESALFVPSPENEKAVIEQILERISKCSLIVTFNGRSFDLPFLHSRAMILGIENIPCFMGHHLDVYEQFKKRMRFSKLSLSHLSRVLGHQTDDQSSGREIPLLYLQYLASGNPELKSRILEHCSSDVDLLEELYADLRSVMDKEDH